MTPVRLWALRTLIGCVVAYGGTSLVVGGALEARRAQLEGSYTVKADVWRSWSAEVRTLEGGLAWGFTLLYAVASLVHLPLLVGTSRSNKTALKAIATAKLSEPFLTDEDMQFYSRLLKEVER